MTGRPRRDWAGRSPIRSPWALGSFPGPLRHWDGGVQASFLRALIISLPGGSGCPAGRVSMGRSFPESFLLSLVRSLVPSNPGFC